MKLSSFPALPNSRLSQVQITYFLRLLAALPLLFLFSPAAVQADALRIRLAQDIALGSWGGTGSKEGNSNVCIYRMNGAGYAVTATASGGAFSLSSGGDSVAFEVAFKASSGTAGTYTALPYNTSRSFSGADESSETCSGGYNANVRVTVSEDELAQAATGSYSGTLIITLTAS